MRHNVKGRKLGRTSEHRLALFRNQLASLVESGRIRTTLAKAKELRPIAEKIVTKGKRGTVDARRQVRRWIAQRELVKKLFDEVAPRFQERNGGYLRSSSWVLVRGMARRAISSASTTSEGAQEGCAKADTLRRRARQGQEAVPPGGGAARQAARGRGEEPARRRDG